MRKSLLIMIVFLFSFIIIGCNDDDDDDEFTSYEWRKTAGPYGGIVNAILLDTGSRAGDRAYIVGKGGVFYTSNSGSSWYAYNNDLPLTEVQSIDGTFGVDTVLFIGIKNKGIYRSLDGGDNWECVNPDGYDPSDKNFYALQMINDSRFYVGVTNNDGTAAKFYYCYYSTNKWIWDERNINTTDNVIYCIKKNPSNTNVVYAATEKEVYYTTNGGSSWIETDLDTVIGEDANVHSLCLIKNSGNLYSNILYAGTQNHGLWLYISEDGGASSQIWKNATDTLPTADIIQALQGKIISDKHILYVGFKENGLYYSDDAYSSTPNWTKKNNLPNSSSAVGVKSLAVEFSDTRAYDIIYRGNVVHGILYSNDSGNNFEEKSTYLQNTYINSLIIKTSDEVITGTDSGIYSTTDGGDTWSRNINSIHKEKDSNGSKYVGLVTNDYTTYYAVTPDIDYTGIAYISTDGGNNWGIDSDTANDFNSNITCIIMGNSPHVFVGTENNYVWYRKGDNDWIKMSDNIINSQIFCLAFASAQGTNGTIYAGTLKGVYYFDDDPTNTGVAWKELNDGLPTNTNGDRIIKSIAVSSNGGEKYLSLLNENSTQDGFYYYNGTQWERRISGLSGNSRKIYVIKLISSNRLYIGTDNGVWYTEDGGITWKERNYKLYDKRVRSLDYKDGYVYVGTAGGGIYKMKE